MKRPHRRIHLLVWITLLPLVGVLFFLFLRERDDPPIMDDNSLPALFVDGEQ